jgi:hypothetical protein
VVSQILEGTLSGDNGLDVESEHGEHSESARGEGEFLLETVHQEMEGLGRTKEFGIKNIIWTLHAWI